MFFEGQLLAGSVDQERLQSGSLILAIVINLLKYEEVVSVKENNWST